MSVFFLTRSFGRTVLALKLKVSLISEFLWPRISMSLLCVLKMKFFVGVFLSVLLQRDERFNCSKISLFLQ